MAPRREDLRAALDQRAADGLYRRRRRLDSAPGAWVEQEGRSLCNFSSNDYLGLAAHPAVAEALADGARRWGAGAGSAHLLGGHADSHQQLEQELAAFTGRQRALLFSTGYMANLGTVDALTERRQPVWGDRLNHASLLDAVRLSGGRLHRYPHADTAALEAGLTRCGGVLVATDGVFSMDGDSAPLAELAQVVRRHDAWFMVDDAHGLGVVGPGGRGSVAAAGLDAEAVPLLVGTLGKAFGTFGAFVAGDEAVIETLINNARTYIYTTALPPAVAEATRASLALIRGEEGEALRGQLRDNVARFRSEAVAAGLPLMASETAIQPVWAGGAEAATAWSAALEARGFLVGAVRPPTVPAGSARLRVSLSARHAEADIEALVAALAATRPAETA